MTRAVREETCLDLCWQVVAMTVARDFAFGRTLARTHYQDLNIDHPAESDIRRLGNYAERTYKKIPGKMT